MRKPKQRKWTETEIRALPENELTGLAHNVGQPEELRTLAAMHLRARQVKDLADVGPIDHAVVAQPHTPVYLMHRYYARRPWSVFNELILHYSNPGSLVLDPFCGGGVTVVEGVRLGRRVLGVDINPLATWITRNELAPVDIGELDAAVSGLVSSLLPAVSPLYVTRCPNCQGHATIQWAKHSRTIRCPHCRRIAVLAKAAKITGKGVGAAGQGYVCPHCSEPCRGCDLLPGDVLVGIHYRCEHCRSEGEKTPDKADVQRYRAIITGFSDTVANLNLPIPTAPFPDGNLQRENAVFRHGVHTFQDLFTKRNLICNGMLKQAILQAHLTPAVRETLLFCFSASLPWTSNLINDTGHGWQRSAYWLPDVFFEQNALLMFSQRYGGGQSTVRRGKQWLSEHIPELHEVSSPEQLVGGVGTHCVLTRSSDNLPIPDGSVDVVVTDPPYGGNVQYAELADFWTVWLADTGVLDRTALDQVGVILKDKEAIQTRHTGFQTAKSLKHYRDMLHAIFREAHRVLRPGGWMVMTFHNLNFAVWNALHAAAHDAGFLMPEHDGMIYQPPIQNYTQTLQLRRAGSMLGDFVVSFQRVEAMPERAMIPEVEMGSKVRRVAAETIAYHGSAGLSTVYMRLIPFLVNNNLLHQVREADLIPFLATDFERRVDDYGNERWYFREEAGEEQAGPLPFVPVEARIEYVIRSMLRECRAATQDQILAEVYSQLINSNAAEYQEIQRVLRRICVLKPGTGKSRATYVLRDDAKAQRVLEVFEGEAQVTTEQEAETHAESEHDLMIEDIAALGHRLEYEVHIGRTEQGKYSAFRAWSRPMVYPAEFGIHPDAFDKITEIDTLWISGQTIVAAFEVEKSTTIDSGINRFRELYAAFPNSTVATYLVIPDDREDELRRKLGSLANRREGITAKVKYVRFSDISGKHTIDLEAVARQVV